MAKVSKTEAELQGLTKVKPKSGESRADYLKRLHAAVAELDDNQWKGLSTAAMNWSNVATKAFDANKPIPDFDDAPNAAPAKKAKAASAEDEDPGEEDDDTETNESGGEEADAEDKTVTKKTKSAAKPAKPAAKKGGAAVGKKGDGYKGHRVGSNKETIHKLYDEKGRDAAIKKASALGLADNTARSWISSWGPSPADKGKK